MFDPLVERTEHIEGARALSAGAMPHAGHHEEAIGTLYLADSSGLRGHALIVINTVLRRQRLIAPAVILEQLAAVGEVRLEVGVRGVADTVVLLFGASDVAIEVECLVIPVPVLEHHVLEEFHRTAEGTWPSQERPPELAPW